jgi:hypothetical protein
MSSRKPQVIYTMPSNEQIQAYSLDVCKGLKTKLGDEYFYRQEFISGFTGFIKRAMKIQTKYLNQQQEGKDAA